MTHPRRRAMVLGAGLLAAGLSTGACTPIPAPGRDSATSTRIALLQRGDLMPDFALVDLDGTPVSNATLDGATVVLTFATPGTQLVDELLDRFATVNRRLGSGSGTTRFVIFTLGAGATGAEALRAGRPPEWIVLTEPAAQIVDLATRFGVMTWMEDDRLAHTLRVTVAGPSVRVADMLEGLSTWSVEDLMASVAAAD